MTGRRRRLVAVGIATIVAVGVAAAGIAVAAGGDRDTPITGAALEKASAAALTQTGGGRVTGTEVGDEDAFYEVEVTRADGSQVDVHLDRSFSFVDERSDGDGAGDKAGGAEDAAEDG